MINIPAEFKSWEQLRENVATFLGQINSNPSLAKAAAVNPIYALEELGCKINPEILPEIEDRIRFNERTVVRLRQLRTAIFEAVGHEFEINSAAELQRVLFEDLKILFPEQKQESLQQSYVMQIDTAPLPPQVGWGEKVQDPLGAFLGTHPVIEQLLEYRRLDASEPRLATRSFYDQVRQGASSAPLTHVRGILKAHLK